MAGLFVQGVGWQLVMGETRVDGFWPGVLLVLLGLAGVIVGLRRLSVAQIAGLTISIAGTAAFGALALVELFVRVQEVGALTTAVGWLARGFGVDLSLHEGRLIGHHGTLLMDWRPSLARLAAFPFALTWIGVLWLFLLAPVRGAWRWFGEVTVLLAGVFVLRVCVLAVLHTTLPETGTATSWVFTLATGLPLVLLAARPAMIEAAGARRSVLQPLALAIMAAAAVIGLRFVDPGAAKTGRVLLADTHGRWEPTDLPFDKENFGRRNAYSYGNFYELLGRYFQTTRITTGQITAARLEGIDVLILKTPTEPYTGDEIDLVEAFVSDGGGLLLIGDHTDLFGMSTFMNRLSSRFGISFRADDTFSLQDEGTSQWRRSAFLPHPIVEDIKSFDYETSASLVVPGKAAIVMAGHALGSEMADYNNPGFFGNIHLDPADRLGFFPQVAALSHGEGRVVAIADSTPFSNFSLYFPGRWELAVASVDYLNHGPGHLRNLRLVAIGVALAALVGALALRGRGTPVLGATGLAVGALTGTALTFALSHGQTAFPEPHTEMPRIAFDRSVSGAAFPPSLDTTTTLDHMAFDTLFTVSQRIGFQPVMTELLDAAMDQARMIVILNPQAPLDPATSTRLFEFVTSGGALLVTDSLLNANSQANAILQTFGLSIALESDPAPSDLVIPDPAMPVRSLVQPLLVVGGGFPVLLDREGRALYSEAEIGHGHVGVLSEAMALTRGSLGNRFYDTPDAKQQEMYNAAFLVLERGMDRAQ